MRDFAGQAQLELAKSQPCIVNNGPARTMGDVAISPVAGVAADCVRISHERVWAAMNWTKINPSLAGSALALVVLTAGLTWSLRAPVHGQEAPPVAARLLWEYKIVLPRDPIDLAVNHEQFNLLGADGWELCATHGETHLKYCIFKRPKR